MGFCKDCISWSHHCDTWKKEWNECDAVDGENDYSKKIKEDDFAIYSFAHDDSGLETGLLTGPMFGCNKFQEGRHYTRRETL